jgi:hypothetical protein
MPPRSQVLLSVLTLTALITAHENSGCSDFTCCSLNGAWDSARDVCACDSPWVGANCSALDLLPAQAPLQGYGMAPNLTTWGGNVVEFGGEFHLFVAEIVNDCPLSDWSTNSQCVHATAATATGPFIRQDVSIGVWCHNPQVVMFPSSAAGPGNTSFALFHIGDSSAITNGDAPELGLGKHVRNCTNSSSSSILPMAPRPHDASAANFSTIQLAADPAGPWTPVSPGPPTCNNPAPLLHPNGTWFLVCSSIKLYSAPTLTGPWVLVLILPTGGAPGGQLEDAFLYLSGRGSWHILFHAFSRGEDPATCANSTVAAHMFSLDGLAWAMSPFPPFGNQVAWSDGTTTRVATRERPKLLFNSAGSPTHLINAVCGGLSACAPTPCVNCKYYGWDFTLVQPLNIA